jgi:hypothetical protein
MTAVAKSSEGVAMYLSVGAAVPATVEPTAITAADPTEVTAAPPVAPAQPFALQQVVFCRDTGFPELDDKYFTIASLIGTAPDITGFTLLGADTEDSAGVLGPIAEMDVYASDDMVKMCLNNFTFNLTAPSSTPAGTYCNPTATLSAPPTSVGTATLLGWIDVDDPAYVELLKAEDDGETRVFTIVLPDNQGQIVAALVITGITWTIPLTGGMGFTASADLKAKPRHLF